MMSTESHYPDYDVRDSLKEWDPLTTDLVLKRLGPFPPLKFIKDEEEPKLRRIAKHLVYDSRDEIIDWVIHFLDQRLNNNQGEYQRKPKSPPEDVLIRKGLQAIDTVAEKIYDNRFLEIKIRQQFEILSKLQVGKAPDIPAWSSIPQKELFDKLLTLTISAYFSHPTVWSEMGYGGPAYPRGYYRTEFGLADPWEAERKEDQ